MGINCHIAVQDAEIDLQPGQIDPKSLCFIYAADVRWVVDDGPLRRILGIPDIPPDPEDADCKAIFWEHLENHEYQLVLDAALVHRQMICKEQETAYHAEVHPHETLLDAQQRFLHCERDLNRVDEWIAYYELAAGLVKLGHRVICYGG